ncbi:S1 family peptidase [Streptosporangium sp. NPDC050855]|uniref:S1 family peptidase n=1 Tax=Streptosporangium sp. NPDC050855 TaxID=3366194 RepID=UPI0037B3F624
MSRRHAVTAGCVLAITALTLAAAPADADPRTGGPGAAEPVGPAVPIATKTPGTPSRAGTPGVTVPGGARAAAPPPGMLEALQRDLGLTRAEAETRLLNEARLIPIAEQMSRRLGDRFGGAWLRAKTAHTLVVASTRAADIPQILAAGAQAEIVPTSLTELSAIKAKLDATLPPQPLVSSVRYIDVKRNKVVVLAPRPDQTENIIESSGLDQTAVIVLPSTEAPLPLYDLVGGNAYYINTVNRCSVGFSVLKGNQQGFVTAGHCGRQGAPTLGFNRQAQGVFQGSVFPGSDYAWVATNAAWTAVAGVDNGEGGIVPVAGARVAIEGASVCRSGSTTDWYCGLIQQRDASVTYPQGAVLELTRTSVCAEPGDSGGSFIAIDQAQGVTSGGSGDCASGGVTYFQPIAEILTAYGLALRTTAGNPPPPTTGTCTGYPTTFTGALAAGRSVYHPRSVYYRAGIPGNHFGCLDGPAGADFDLYLQKWSRSAWRVVASSRSAGPDEKITYTGTPGFYRYRVASVAGSGAYTVGLRAPSPLSVRSAP